MQRQTITDTLTQGTVYFTDHAKFLADVQWIAHPVFSGVSMKHMLTGEDTGGTLSSHLVRIDPHCCLALHNHAHQLELHEVLDGNGRCRLAGRDLTYEFGAMAIIPQGEEHMVEAGANGLTLLAKFFPALL